jgi:hypothetical protein
MTGAGDGITILKARTAQVTVHVLFAAAGINSAAWR